MQLHIRAPQQECFSLFTVIDEIGVNPPLHSQKSGKKCGLRHTCWFLVVNLEITFWMGGEDLRYTWGDKAFCKRCFGYIMSTASAAGESITCSTTHIEMSSCGKSWIGSSISSWNWETQTTSTHLVPNVRTETSNTCSTTHTERWYCGKN